VSIFTTTRYTLSEPSEATAANLVRFVMTIEMVFSCVYIEITVMFCLCRQKEGW